jgi:hypothetical protein
LATAGEGADWRAALDRLAPRRVALVEETAMANNLGVDSQTFFSGALSQWNLYVVVVHHVETGGQLDRG